MSDPGHEETPVGHEGTTDGSTVANAELFWLIRRAKPFGNHGGYAPPSPNGVPFSSLSSFLPSF